MADTGYRIVVVRGDNIGVQRTATNIPVGCTLDTAWLTVKAALTDTFAQAVLAKKITAADTVDGQILDVGSGAGSLPVGTGLVLFTLAPEDTRLFVAHQDYHYDIQLKMQTGEIYTLEEGYWSALPEVTDVDS